jgi:hypothetical protein
VVEQLNTVHNERLKLLANFMNTISVAFIVTSFVIPSITGQLAGGIRLVVAISWICLAFGLNCSAQLVLGYLRP